MAGIEHHLAPHRIAVWLVPSKSGEEVMDRFWHLLRILASRIDWDSLPEYQPSLLAVHFGIVVNAKFTLQEVGYSSIWCCMIGSPTKEIKSRVLEIISGENIDGLIRLDPDPPVPHHPFYSLIFHGLLLQNTYMLMDSANRRSYESWVGMDIIQPSEMEWGILDVLPAEDALPTLIRVLGRNLRRWINEPKTNVSAMRLTQHAQELYYIGAIRSAGVVAGQALELFVSDLVGLPSVEVKKKKLTLGKLISTAQTMNDLEQGVVDLMWAFSATRAKCAHALVEGNDDDIELQSEVDEFIMWLKENCDHS